MSLSIAMLSPNINRLEDAGTGPAPGVSALGSAQSTVPQADFAQTLASMAADAIATIKAGETTAMAGMKGQASLQQVVQAVMQAEQTLQTVVAVRDKVVGAYLEISRMQI
jgi:flagellar hook-basal body complex protein FliE